MPKESSSVRDTLSSLFPSEGSPSPNTKPSLRIHFPSTTVSQPGVQLTKQETANEPSFSVCASALDNLTFPNCDLSPTTSADTASSEGFGPSHDPGALVPKYLIAGLDLDPPFPSFPVLGPILHSLRSDMTLETKQLSADDEFIPLGSGQGSGAIAGYMGPAPPGLSSPHRYLFMLWEQPQGWNGEKIKEELNLSEDGVGLMGRMRWDQEEFEKKLGLGKVVAGNYFVC